VIRDRQADADQDAADPTPAASAERRGSLSTPDKRAAMELPLVRDAIEVFGDALPIEFRDE
ncbi:MAG: hypothetical protein GVY24_00625, partial [Planctomycetes bacterium]|nr:hypothetical protein [Planctomycetota bacterium]